VTLVARFFAGRRMLRCLVRFEQVRIHSRECNVGASVLRLQQFHHTLHLIIYEGRPYGVVVIIFLLT